MESSSSSRRRLPRPRLGAVVAITVVAVGAWLLLKGGDDKPRRSIPAAASVQDLKALASSVGHPVYWVGEAADHHYEVTQTRSGQIYIRYLPSDVPIDDGRPIFLTVGTYPKRDAFAQIQAAANRPGAQVSKLRGGGLAVSKKGNRKNVYFAYPGAQYMIEVFATSARRARHLVVSGKARPIS